ncbi:ATP-binding cassette domain-containing protein [Desulfobotulus sp. H1]|uniref:ATP-binding cassette domain-containing protein n=1 Tax=Desulfobotulus pelophilus TaxID=2823377 RepID=A0ABT3NC25_9BACT|nr:ATP-binding cassette domain-containing protein [Desulfobotulus pelophilus]MCW7755018.1 ATP-binding cassette domain-containing protein [Desulfobotulus pelophilus]
MMKPNIKIRIRDLRVAYGKSPVFANVSLDIAEGAITAITGPSGVGKSTFLFSLNRLLETENQVNISGSILLATERGWQDIHAGSMDVYELRRKVSVVFQNPNPLPMGIFANVALPLRLKGIRRKAELEEKVIRALKQAHLWEEVGHRLTADARTLSGGQQQRLCIARSLVMQPEVLLLDEPTSSLDASAEAAIESLLLDLKKTCTLVLVSHSRRQVKNLADLEFAMTCRDKNRPAISAF